MNKKSLWKNWDKISSLDFPTPPILQSVLRWGQALLKSSGSFSASEARREAEIIVQHLVGLTEVQLFTQAEKLLPDVIAEQVQDGLMRRFRGEPTAYILQERGFYGFTFKVGPGVLIPRPETELLVGTVLNWIDEFEAEGYQGAVCEGKAEVAGPRVLDLCTGSGCVILSIKALRPEIEAEAQDLSAETFRYFSANRSRLVPKYDLKWHGGDLFAEIEGRFQFISANPPYIGISEGPAADQDVAAYEPSLALFSGRDGLDLIKKLISQAPQYLQPGGGLALEIGCTQGEAVRSLMQAAGFENIKVLQDFNDLDRVVCGRWQL